MAFRFFTSNDWQHNSCADKNAKIKSKSESGGIETWEYLGMTDDVDWDLDMNLNDLVAKKTKKYVVLREYGKPMSPEYVIVLKSNGEVNRGGARYRFQCSASSSGRSPSKTSRSSPKRCPTGSRRNKTTGQCVKY
jgi:hypothetical protein